MRFKVLFPVSLSALLVACSGGSTSPQISSIEYEGQFSDGTTGHSRMEFDYDSDGTPSQIKIWVGNEVAQYLSFSFEDDRLQRGIFEDARGDDLMVVEATYNSWGELRQLDGQPVDQSQASISLLYDYRDDGNIDQSSTVVRYPGSAYESATTATVRIEADYDQSSDRLEGLIYSLDSEVFLRATLDWDKDGHRIESAHDGEGNLTLSIDYDRKGRVDRIEGRGQRYDVRYGPNGLVEEVQRRSEWSTDTIRYEYGEGRMKGATWHFHQEDLLLFDLAGEVAPRDGTLSLTDFLLIGT